jgi:hypothetical protein
MDHTTGTGKGYLMQADLSKRQVNDYARLKSPLLAELQCMTFYYHLFGHGGTLNLYMALDDNLGIPFWTRAGSQGDVWRFGRMTTTKNNANVVFEGNKKHLPIDLFINFYFLKLSPVQIQLAMYPSMMLFLLPVNVKKVQLLVNHVHLLIFLHVVLHKIVLYHH